MIIKLRLEGPIGVKQYRFDVGGKFTHEWHGLSDAELDAKILRAAGYLYPLPWAAWCRGEMHGLLIELACRDRAPDQMVFHR